MENDWCCHLKTRGRGVLPYLYNLRSEGGQEIEIAIEFYPLSPEKLWRGGNKSKPRPELSSRDEMGDWRASNAMGLGKECEERGFDGRTLRWSGSLACGSILDFRWGGVLRSFDLDRLR